MNTAPASRDDYILFRQDRFQRAAADVEALKALSSHEKNQEGDLGMDFYR